MNKLNIAVKILTFIGILYIIIGILIYNNIYIPSIAGASIIYANMGLCFLIIKEFIKKDYIKEREQ